MDTRNAYELCVQNMDILLNSTMNAIGRVCEISLPKNTKTEANIISLYSLIWDFSGILRQLQYKNMDKIT